MWDNHNPLSRRAWLRVVAVGALGAFAAACQRVVAPLTGALSDPVTRGAPVPAAAPTLVEGVPVTPTADFYTVSYRGNEPPTLPADWKLTLTGAVDHPLALTLDEIKALPSVTEMRTLECISNPVGGDLISNAVWQAVRFKDLLAQAGVQPSARYLKLEALDGYSTGIPLELGQDDEALLAYMMNGEPLPAIHGGPLRCLWPGRYGMKQPKWIQTITAIDKEYIGYWEQQGWSNTAAIRPFSRIDSPSDLSPIAAPTLSLAGLAMTGASGLAKLEISWDDAKQWQEAELTRGPSPYVWTSWKWTGASLPAGRHTLYARATDRSGQVQTRADTINLLGGTYPDGTDQMHSIVLDFKG